MRPIVFSLATVALLVGSLQAQTTKDLQKKGSASIAPIGFINLGASDFGAFFNNGWGAALQGTLGRGVFTLLGEAGYDSFGVLDGIEDENPFSAGDLGIWHFAGGLRTTLGPIYVGGLAGYWTEVDEFDVVPMAGLHIWKFDIGARYKGLLGDGDWLALGVGIHIGRW